MIVKRNLSPRRVLEYIAAPLAWAALWAVAAPAAFTVADDRRLMLPFPVVATLGAALAVFVAFRNNSAFARWNEARAAWQTVLVASRTLTRQVIASTRHAAASGNTTEHEATGAQRTTSSPRSATPIRRDHYRPSTATSGEPAHPERAP